MRTREWKWGVVIGVVSMSYCSKVSATQENSVYSWASYTTVMSLLEEVRCDGQGPLALMLPNVENWHGFFNGFRGFHGERRVFRARALFVISTVSVSNSGGEGRKGRRRRRLQSRSFKPTTSNAASRDTILEEGNQARTRRWLIS